MKADFKATKASHTELLKKSQLPCGNTVADIKEKLKKYYYLYVRDYLVFFISNGF